MKNKRNRFYTNFARIAGRLKRLGFERISLVSGLRWNGTHERGHVAFGSKNFVEYHPARKVWSGNLYSSELRYAVYDAHCISNYIKSIPE